MKTRFLSIILAAACGITFSGIGMAEIPAKPLTEQEMAAKAAKVKFRWGKKLKPALKQSEETGLPVLVLFTGSSWCGFCVALEKEILSKKEFKKGLDGVAIGVRFDFASADAIDKCPEAKKYKVRGVPHIVVLDKEGNVLGTTGYMRGKDVNYYIDFVKKFAPKTEAAK